MGFAHPFLVEKMQKDLYAAVIDLANEISNLSYGGAKKYFADKNSRGYIAQLVRHGLEGRFQKGFCLNAFLYLYSQLIAKHAFNPEVALTRDWGQVFELMQAYQSLGLALDLYDHRTFGESVKSLGNVPEEELVVRVLLFVPSTRLTVSFIKTNLGYVRESYRSIVLLAIISTRYHFTLDPKVLNFCVLSVINGPNLTTSASGVLQTGFFFASYWDLDPRLVAKFKHALCKFYKPPRARPKLNSMSRTRKVLLIIHEAYAPDHSMNRCWGKFFRSLNEKFSVSHLLAGKGKNAQNNGEHNVYGPLSLGEILDFCDTRQPDIIFYPSVGMTSAVFALANTRLAPRQIAGLGHPGQYLGMEIDGTVSFADSRGIVGQNNYDLSGFSIMPRHYKKAEVFFDDPGGDVKTIVIYGKIAKYSRSFLAFLVRLEKRLSVRFIFMVGESSANYFAAERQLRSFGFHQMTCVPFVGFEYVSTYFKEAHCSIALFPFGGSDSTRDLLYSSIPLFALKSTHPGNGDQVVMRELGLSDWLFDSEDQMIKYIEKFLQSHQMRTAEREKLRERLFQHSNSVEDAPAKAVEGFCQFMAGQS